MHAVSCMAMVASAAQFAEHAWQEKAISFDRLAQARGRRDEPGDGRKTLGNEAARCYDRIRQRCAEGIVGRAQHIHHWLQLRG